MDKYFKTLIILNFISTVIILTLGVLLCVGTLSVTEVKNLFFFNFGLFKISCIFYERSCRRKLTRLRKQLWYSTNQLKVNTNFLLKNLKLNTLLFK